MGIKEALDRTKKNVRNRTQRGMVILNCASKGSFGHVHLAFALEDDSNKRVLLDRRQVFECGRTQAAWWTVVEKGVDMEFPSHVIASASAQSRQD